MINEPDITSFINLVNEARATTPRYATLDEAAAALGLQSNAGQRMPPQSSDIWERIRDQITGENGRAIGELRSLSRALFRRAWFSPNMGVYSDTIRRLLFGASADWRFRDFSDRTSWIVVIWLLECLELVPNAHCDTNSLIGMERDVAVASAVRRLQDRGYRFRHEGERIEFEDGELERCCNELHSLFEKANGKRVILSLFRHLLVKNAFRRGRFLVGRISRPVHAFNANPAIPFGYLINVSFRHLHAEKPTANPQRIVEEILRLATDIVSAVDIETYSLYVHLFATHDSLPKYVQEIILADHMLTFRQIVPVHALEIMRGVFRWVDHTAMREQVGWDMSDALKLAEHILTSAPPNAASVTVTHDGLRKSGFSSRTLNQMLPYFAHDSREVNRDYLTPLDAMKADAGFKPLVTQPGGQYFGAAPSLCSIGFYEAMAVAVRSVFKRTDENIGNAIESMVEAAFTTRGIRPSVVSRKYAMASVTGECDIVLETEKTIVLIELKKKSMTRQAQSGDALKGFLDIFGGVLNTQAQLGQHELQLRELGYIEFVDKSRIDLKGRDIERLAVTLLDWGGTQDRAVLRQIAQLLVAATVDSNRADPSQLEDLADANATLRKLADQSTRLMALGTDTRELYANWWFMSVPQLLFLLTDARDADGFCANLRKVKFITTGVLDLYQEFISMTELHAETART